MCGDAVTHAVELTMYTYVGLGVLGGIVWTRDQLQSLVHRDEDAGGDQ